MKIIVTFLLGFLFLQVEQAFAVATTATATATVITAISITRVSNLNFGTAIQGSSSLTLAPANASAAVFNVTGQRNRVYTIILPSSATMITGTGALATQQILVNNFTSTPTPTGLLNNSGTQTLRVGAQRAGLLTNQVSGNYASTFTINVIY